MPRRAGEVGLYFLMGMRWPPCYLDCGEELDPLALGQAHDRFLPRLRPSQRPPEAAWLARHVNRVHGDDAHLEDRLDGVLDLELVRLARHLEDVASLLVELRILLSDHRP